MSTDVDRYLWAWAGIVASGMRYGTGPSRCTGTGGYVDCSGGTVLALNRAGVPTDCTNSFALAALCHTTPRPQWMTDQYGPGVGTQISMAQAIGTPGAWGFHGNDEGQQPDPSGDGHIKTSVGFGRSVEAMSHQAGVGYSTFDNPAGFITYCALPPMLLDGFAPTVEDDVLIFICPNKPNKDGNTPIAEFVPAGPIFAYGGFILRHGASLAQDQPTGDPEVRELVHQGPAKWLSAKDAGRAGIVILNDNGDTPEVYWS